MGKNNPWRYQNRSFLGDMSFGKLGEKKVETLLKNSRNVAEVIDLRDDKEAQKKDIDYKVFYKDGRECLVEVKTDKWAHRTGNIPFEMYSHNNPGCFARTESDFIFFVVAMTGMIYVIDSRKFKEYANRLLENGEKLKTMGDEARGFLCKIETLINEKIVVQQIQTPPLVMASAA